MKKTVFTLMILVVIIVLFACDSETKKSGYNPEKIRDELLAKYNELNGVFDDSKVDLWDTYFLNHSEIGNTHDNHTDVSWETFHNAISKDKTLPHNERITVETYDIKVHVINKNTTWVKGKLKMISPNGTVSNNYFYDSLIKTEDGWRVFNSVVNTIAEQ